MPRTAEYGYRDLAGAKTLAEAFEVKQVLMTNAGAGSLGALTEAEVEDIFNAMRVRKTETRIHWHEFIAAGLSLALFGLGGWCLKVEAWLLAKRSE